MSYLIPKAKKNIHQCEYHLVLMTNSHNIEEFEINFTAFVTSARSVTFVLRKEFGDNDKFLKWYGDKENPAQGTKIREMREDPLCNFFLNLRNSIEKEGISGLKGVSTNIQSFNSKSDVLNKPEGMKGFVIGPSGIFIRVYPNSPRADLIPAITKAVISTSVILENTPNSHLGQNIKNKNIIEICKLYYEYLKKLVEEFTEIVNKY